MDIFYQYFVGEKLLLFDRLKLFYLFYFYFVTSTDEISKISGKLINKTSSPKGNDCSPESNVPRSNVHGNQRPEIELVRAFI